MDDTSTTDRHARVLLQIVHMNHPHPFAWKPSLQADIWYGGVADGMVITWTTDDDGVDVPI